ncbi:MAG: YicC family protein [Gammaproteobacteria bacterium]|nr:YicC family protein [Gammaproteobacteria bacterium]MCH9743951.1 YicC family protein [Gammaproteobacteria bacterium]
MICSMTAFARKQKNNDFGTITWEMRSVNHRYLEMSLRLPDGFRHLEPTVREMVAEHLKRGKVDCTLKFSPGEAAPIDFEVNEPVLDKLFQVREQVKQKMPDLQANLMNVLSWPGVLRKQQQESSELDAVVMAQLKEVLSQTIKTREREGVKIADFLQQRLQLIATQVQAVEKKMPEIIASEREAICQRFEELKLEIDRERLEQEMLWLMQKMDVAEEVQRLQGHLTEVKRLLDKGGVLGRRLDFLMQELNREANTLSSKSVSIDVTQAAVEIKVLIEQMREQVQNIE